MRKRLLFVLALMVCGFASVWADEVTPEQAKEIALNFMKSHSSRRAAPAMEQPVKVSGLYVFNVSNNGGFVIVSNDDQTTPILGFGENGNIDTEKMPANMRAWLQGYADEIAWLQKNGYKAPRGRAAARAPRRIGSHATTDIPPLISTKWNQGAPYNNLCPLYDGSSKSATGCVATAMAQVMNYHQWPKADPDDVESGYTTAIPGYTTESHGIVLTGLPAIRFDWANMKNTYTGSETDATADAVAELMQYCGYSVEMDYGPESGSNTDKVAAALKAYFDYNKNTTQFVSRSLYTYANWTDLIYHELEHQRPVVYGGMSSGGGHEFVCDGYEYRNGKDYFHINWGWGGQSDNYFVLSALDPDQQGIGGSSSNDGFHYGQDAVIGIQPSTGTGTIASVTPSNINLTLNSITPNIAYKDRPVNITLNITNNSTDDYDGDIYVGVKVSDDDYSLLDGKNFNIPTGQTQDCVIRYTFKQIGTYQLVLFLPNAIGTYSTDGVVKVTLTVENLQATNEKVPLYGQNCDELSKSQFIIPAEDLEDMYNATLNGVTFYSTNGNVDWDNPQFEVYLKEVEETTISELKDWTTLTKVYTGNLSIVNGLMVIDFNTPYQYHGGNLLMGFNQTVEGGEWIESTWVGTNVTGASLGGYNNGSQDYISQQNFLPKTTFDYSGGVAKPKGLAVTLTPGDGTVATLNWTERGTATAWEICLNNDEAHPIAANINPFTLTGLTPETEYTAKVRAVDGNNVSLWSNAVTFTPTDAYTITVNDGTATSDHVPLYGYYADDNTTSQFIIPAASLTAMQWGTINQLTFYATQSSVSWGNAKFEVYMANVDNTTFTNSTFVWDGMTKVMNAGSLSISGNQMVITLDTPFQYTDRNLMIGVKETVKDEDYSQSTWYGINTTENTAIGNVNSSGSSYELKQFLPKTTFDFTPNPVPTNIVASLAANGATLTWTGKGDSYNVQYRTAASKDGSTPAGSWQSLASVTEATATLSGLATNNGYEYRIQSVKDGNTSDWSEIGDFALLTLQDNGDNSSLLYNNNGRKAYVTLSDRTLAKDGNWNTFCVPYGMTAAQIAEEGNPLHGATIRELKAEDSSLSSDGELTLTFKNASAIEAGKPYIIKWETTGTNILSPAFNGVIINNLGPTAVEFANNAGTEPCKFVGQYKPFAITSDNLNEIIMLGSGSMLGYSKNTRELKCFRAHFWVQPNGTSAGARSINLDLGDGAATSINLVNTDDAVRQSDWYSVDGIRLQGEPTKKGVYIYNNKKVIIK